LKPELYEQEDVVSESTSNKGPNLALIGSQIDSMEYISNTLKGTTPHLIILNISNYIYKIAAITTSRIKKESLDLVEQDLVKLDDSGLSMFISQLEIILEMIYSKLSNYGYFTVIVNGTTKYFLKQMLDLIYHRDNFINEIIIDSPLKIFYTDEIPVFERTNYILLYSKRKNQKINPVYNEKQSGGYWHSFVSKGQGSPKDFLIDGKLIRLYPPVGTHWKLKQEKIIKLCKEGKLRLNKKGNPEYWVPEKKGFIIDTNWLDICFSSPDTSNAKFWLKIFDRLFNLLLKPCQIVYEISPVNAAGSLAATKNEMKWIGVFQNNSDYKKVSRNLCPHQPINLSQKIIKTKLKSPVKPKLDSEVLSPYSIERSKKMMSKIISGSLYQGSKTVHINTLIHGDCLEVLSSIQTELHQKIKLIYIDPPFYTGLDEEIYVPVGLTIKASPNSAATPKKPLRLIAYNNVILSDQPILQFKSWFKQRLALMKPLLTEDGLIFVRFDYHYGHYAQFILNEVFGQENFVVEFIIRRMKKNLSEKQAHQQTHLIVHSDSLFVYRATNRSTIDLQSVTKKKRKLQDQAEIEYKNDNLWIDIAGYQKVKRTTYPTENAETLLNRIIKITTSQGDIVADFFAGSGTTLAVAEKLGRRWVGVDIGALSINEIRKRLLKIESRSSFRVEFLEHPRSNPETLKPKNKVSIQSVLKDTELALKLTNYEILGELSQVEENNFLDLIDYWEIDWDYQNFEAGIEWYSFRKIERKQVVKRVEAVAKHKYHKKGEYQVFINVIDIFGNKTQNLLNFRIN
jgi:DNA modification methylase